MLLKSIHARTASAWLQTCRSVCAGMNGGVRRFIVRTGLAISCLVTARFVPFLALLMALIGSFLTINVSLIFPVGVTLHACGVRIGVRQGTAWHCMHARVPPTCNLPHGYSGRPHAGALSPEAAQGDIP